MPVEQLDKFIQALESSPDDKSREPILQAVGVVLEFHRSAFQRLLEILRQQGLYALIHRFLEDPLLESVLRGYDLVEGNLEEKVHAALETVRPFLWGHGGDIKLIGVRDRVAYLQFIGSCHGCSASLVTFKGGIEKALHEYVPALLGIEVVGLTSTEAAKEPKKWVPLLHWFELKAGEFLKVLLFEEEVLVCTVDQRAFALKNRCPAGHQNLEKARLEGLFIRCPCHGYRFDLRSGRCMETPGLALEVLPVTLEEGIIKVDL